MATNHPAVAGAATISRWAFPFAPDDPSMGPASRAACQCEYGDMPDHEPTGPSEAQDAVADLHHGLDSARRLVERTRFLLAGDAAQEGDALALDPAAAAAQAAAEAPASDTVQNPSGE
jgi:hypothetical protein